VNSIDISKCIFKKLTQELVQEASPFDCGKSDLNQEPLGLLGAGTKGCYISKYRKLFVKKQGKSYEI